MVLRNFSGNHDDEIMVRGWINGWGFDSFCFDVDSECRSDHVVPQRRHEEALVAPALDVSSDYECDFRGYEILGHESESFSVPIVL